MVIILLFNLQIKWELPGIQTARVVGDTYCRNSHGAIIMYDVCDISSFDLVENWYNTIKEKNNYHVPTIIVGNKIDRNGLRRVSYEKGKV